MQELSWLEPPGSSQFSEGNNNNTFDAWYRMNNFESIILAHPRNGHFSVWVQDAVQYYYLFENTGYLCPPSNMIYTFLIIKMFSTYRNFNHLPNTSNTNNRLVKACVE